MGKMRRFLGFIICLCGIFSVGNLLAASYTCPDYMQYTSCEPGYYMTYNGEYNGTPQDGNDCTICPAGSYCPGGTADKSTCPAGSYCPKGTGTPNKCPGSFSNSSDGATSITNCYYVVDAGYDFFVISTSSYSVTFAPCPEGYYCPGGYLYVIDDPQLSYQSLNKKCPAEYPTTAPSGSHSNQQISDCYKDATVEPGKYLSNGEILTCPAGSYCPGLDKIYYPAEDGSNTNQGINPCPAPYTKSPAGASDSSQCYIDVPGGYALPTTLGQPQQCAEGQYKEAHTLNKGETSTCSSCPSKWSNSVAGATSINECFRIVPPGKAFFTGGGGDYCAESGEYSPGGNVYYPDGLAEKNCPELGEGWSYSNRDCSKSWSDCEKSRDAGPYGNCANGMFYQKGASETTWMIDMEKTTATALAGQYVDYENGKCTYCEGATYSMGGAVSSCTDCPEGYTDNLDSGKTSADKCQMLVPAGYKVGTGESAPTKCSGGTYNDEAIMVRYAGASMCDSCTGATYSEEGATSCTACPGNYTSNTDNGKDNINKCEISVPENYYIASAGDDEPTACPAGYTNAPENVSYNSVSECDPDPYTINLDKNGGTGTTDETQICYHEQSCALPEVELTKPYFTFTGWGTTPDCVSGSYEMTFTSAQTIYACWSQNTIECQIGKYYDGKTFVDCPSGKYCPGTGYANEGTPGCASSCPVAPNGETVNSPSDASEFTDCYFACDLDVEHASSVTPIQELVYAISNSEYESCTFNVVCDTGYNVNNNATENPSCTPKQYTITLDKNGGTGSVQSTINCTFDSKICELPDAMSLTKPGYSIGVQWCSGTNGEAPCYTGGTNITENISADATDITLYATWNPNVYEISLDDADATVAGSPATIYLKYSTGWFTDSSAKQAITKLSILPKKTGYEFAGYYSTQSGGTQIINSDGVLQTTPAALQISTSPTTIYARWSAGLTTCQPGTYYTGTGSDCTECPAGSYCTGGKYPTDSGIQEGIESCAALESGDWEYSEIGASSASQCYKQCESYDVIYGTAIPLEEKVFYSNDCEFKGVSETGNPCDIIDGKCVETSCKSDYEMKDGLCVACNREFAMTYKPDGNCRVASCVAGYHPRDKQCELDIKECELPNALYSEQTWDFNTNAFGVCTPIECEDGYHIASNACISDSQQCNVENGIGVKEWNHTTQKWDKCIAVSCNPGYSNDPSETNERDKQCGECKNKYAVKGELAVSSYVQGCEIAACMYQGERYNLENNECVPICPTEEYEDETGTMVWDAISKKCVRTCKEGYTMW